MIWLIIPFAILAGLILHLVGLTLLTYATSSPDELEEHEAKIRRHAARLEMLHEAERKLGRELRPSEAVLLWLEADDE